MRIFPFIQYFFYLGINWNWRIAFYILLHEIKGEKKYGIRTTGSNELKKIQAQGIDISHATVYMPASYLLLEELFPKIPADHHKHFLDIGCGKGRALCVAAYHGFNKITGVDFSKEFCVDAIANLNLVKCKYPSLEFSILEKDAAQIDIPPDTDCIFFFNPFDEVIMKAVAKNVSRSYQKKPRDIFIIYLNPLYKNIWLHEGYKEIYYTQKMKYMEAVILKKTAPG